MYFLARNMGVSRIPALVAALVFVLNQYFISRFASGHLPFAYAYALFPLLLLLYLKILAKDSVFVILCFATLSWIIISFTRLDVILYSVPILIIVTVARFTSLRSKANLRILLIRLTKAIAIGSPILFGLSAFQIIPILSGAKAAFVSTDISIPIPELEFWSLSFKKSLLGFSRELGVLNSQGGISWSVHPLLTEISYEILMAVIPVIALLSLIFRRDWLIASLIATGLVGAFLAKGPTPPGQDVYLWLYNNVPLFGVLKTPNRWIMLGYIAYPLLIAVTMQGVFSWRPQIPHGLTWINRIPWRPQIPHGLTWINRIPWRPQIPHGLTWINRIPWRPIHISLIVIPLSLIAVSLVTVSWYITVGGIRTWNPPLAEKEPHEWIAQQEGIFRVATVPYFQEFMKVNGDFWTHDLGYSSFMYSGHPVAGIGSWKTGPAYSFMSYTHQLMLEGEKDKWADLLGQYGIKFIVVQGYDPTDFQSIPLGFDSDFQRKFLNEQNDLSIVFDNGTSLVYENLSWQPIINESPTYNIYIGGLSGLLPSESITDMPQYIPKISLADIRNSHSFPEMYEIVQQGSEIIFTQTELEDILLELMPGSVSIGPSDFENTDVPFYVSPYFTTKHGGWFGSIEDYRKGRPILSGQTLSAESFAKTKSNFVNSVSGKFDLWVRMKFGPDRSSMTIMVDNQEAARLTPWSPADQGFRWLKASTIDLEKGTHSIELINEDAGVCHTILNPTVSGLRPKNKVNDIDKIYLVPSDNYQDGENLLRKLFNNKSMTFNEIRRFPSSSFVYDEGSISTRDIEIPWTASEPDKVLIESHIHTESEKAGVKYSSFAIGTEGGARKYYTFAQAKFSPFMDLSNEACLTLSYQGDGSEQIPSLTIFFNPTNDPKDFDNWARFNINNNGSDWETAVFDLSQPDQSNGYIDWENVSLIRLQGSNKDQTGTIKIDPISLTSILSSKAINSNLLVSNSFWAPSLSNLDVSFENISHKQSHPLLMSNEEELKWVAIGQGIDVEYSRLTDGEQYTRIFVNPEQELSEKRSAATIAEIQLDKPVNLSGYDAISLPIQSINQGDVQEAYVGLLFYFSEDMNNWARFNIATSTLDQNLYTATLSNPNAKNGTLNWSEVSLIRLQIIPLEWQGSLALGPLKKQQTLDLQTMIKIQVDEKAAEVLQLGGNILLGLKTISEVKASATASIDSKVEDTKFTSMGEGIAWQIVEPATSTIQVSNQNNGPVTHIRINSPRVYSTVSEINLSEPLDISNYDYLLLPIDASDTEAHMGLVFYFSEDKTNWARFSIDRKAILEKTYIANLANPAAFEGKVDWSQLKSIRLQIAPMDWQGHIEMGELNPFKSLIVRPSYLDNVNVNLGIVEAGFHDINIESTSPITAGSPSIILSNTLSPNLPNTEPSIKSIRKINPGRYSVEIETKYPFMLTFSESYHPLWKAIIDKREIPSIQTDSFINGFWMDRTGKYSVDIEFTGQQFVNLGYILTGITILGLVISLILVKWYRKKPPGMESKQ